jgi:tetratricopeptide (TPR) repeat protein
MGRSVTDKIGKKNIKNTARAPASSIAVILIILLGVVSYANSVNGKFVYDDSRLIENNIFVKNISYLPSIFTKDIGAGAGSSANYYNFYRPIQMLTYVSDHFFWGLDPRGFHITNILLHIAAALALYFLISILFQNKILSFFTGALFVVHPVHTEAVSYIAGRADMLSVLFILLFFIFYAKDQISNKPAFRALALLCYCAALLSKESSLIAPFLLLLCHFTFDWKIKRSELVSIVSISLLYLLLRGTVFNFRASVVLDTGTFLQRVPGFFYALAEYMKLLVMPFGLHMEYGQKLLKFSEPKAIAGVLILALMLFYIFKRWKSDKLTSFSISWFLIALLPVSNLYPINAYMAEHWLYLPSVGFFLIVAGALSAGYGDKRYKIAAIVIAISVVSYFSYLTIAQNEHWKGPVEFYEYTLKHGGNNVRIFSNLGMEYLSRGDNEKAIEMFKKAIEAKTDTAGAYNNLGIAYSSMQDERMAIEAYEKAIAADPSFAEAYNNLGNSYSSVGRKEEALRAYSQAIKINPNYAEAYNNIAGEYADINEAISAYKKAIDINPRYAEAYYNLSRLYEASGNTKEAARLYKRSKELNPGLP